MQRCEHLADGVAGRVYPLPGRILAELCDECLIELQARLEEQQRPATPIEEYARRQEAEMVRCGVTKIVTKKDKYGVAKKEEVPDCSRMAEPGSKFCPRHKFLHELEQHNAGEKAKMAQKAEAAGIKTPSAMPATRRQMIEKGYTFTGTGTCRDCNAQIEWWQTPAKRPAPFEPMPHESSFSTSHFGKCKGAQFRRSA